MGLVRTVDTEVLVIGAGPAGSGAALSLAGKGVQALVIDRARFPRDKACGDGLAPRSVAAFRRLGLEDALVERGFRPIGRCRIFGTGGEHVEADQTPHGSAPGYSYVVPRRDLDAMLVGAVRAAGGEVWEGVRALGPLEGQGWPAVEALSDEGETLRIRARVLIAADGSRGSYSRRAMPEWRLAPYGVAIRLYMEGVQGVEDTLCFFLDNELLPGYGWVFPGGGPGRPANVGVGLAVAALQERKVGLRQLLAWFLGPNSTAWPYLAQARAVSEPAAFPMQLSFQRGWRRAGTTLFVGDAANLISPLTGEGIAYALESAEEAAEAVARALASGWQRDLARYQTVVWRRFAGDYLGAFLLRQILVHPRANNLAVDVLRRDREFARGGIGILTNTIPPHWLLRPALWAKILAPRRLAKLVRSRPR